VDAVLAAEALETLGHVDDALDVGIVAYMSRSSWAAM